MKNNLYFYTLCTLVVHQVVNLYTNDGQRIFDGVSIAPMILAGPLLAIGATAYAIYLIGAWALIGFAVLLLLLPMQVVGSLWVVCSDRSVLILYRQLDNDRRHPSDLPSATILERLERFFQFNVGSIHCRVQRTVT